MIVEPIMMNVGILMPDPGYHQALREITKKNGALLIFDEVKTGGGSWRAAALANISRRIPHRVPREIDRGWVFAGGICFNASGDGLDLRSSRFSWRHLQH